MLSSSSSTTRERKSSYQCCSRDRLLVVGLRAATSRCTVWWLRGTALSWCSWYRYSWFSPPLTPRARAVSILYEAFERGSDGRETGIRLRRIRFASVLFVFFCFRGTSLLFFRVMSAFQFLDRSGLLLATP